jgi:hypothetical protein
MMLIWYNPDLDIYEGGAQGDYNFWTKVSINRDRFEILHEFTEHDPTRFIAEKIVKSLNLARIIAPSREQFFA